VIERVLFVCVIAFFVVLMVDYVDERQAREGVLQQYGGLEEGQCHLTLRGEVPILHCKCQFGACSTAINNLSVSGEGLDEVM